MDAVIAAAAIVFLAELGDRTQLLVLSLSARHRPAPVIGGIVLGYAVTTVASVTLGTLLGTAFPERPVQIVSGLLFLGFALWTILDDDADEDLDDAHDEDDEDDGGGRNRAGIGLALSLAGALTISEIGDKSMLATATLAADRNAPVAVATGALIGVLAAAMIGVTAGRLLAGRVSDRLLRLSSAALFTAFGIALLVGLA